jgi:transposase
MGWTPPATVVGIDVPKSRVKDTHKEESKMEHTLVGLDLAKSVFEVAVSERPGVVCRRRRLDREELLEFFAQLPRATVVMEACGSAHYWARRLAGLGHTPILLPPRHVRPYVVGNKTDRTDAKGILEAYRNKEICPVPVKSVAQQLLSSLHRLRSAWVKDRTARINTLRGLLREFGHFIPVGPTHAVPRAMEVLHDPDSVIPAALRPHLEEVCGEIAQLDERIRRVERRLEALAVEIPHVEHLRSIPGVGLLTSTALVAFVGDVHRFPTARHLASYLGLTPQENSSGMRRRLGAISKRGDVYLRMLLIHGARSALRAASTMKAPDRLRAWALRLRETRGYNKASVALANKLARIAWAVAKNNRPFETQQPAA